ncbi:MAG TPA: pyridoxal-phosphate dependent enzyme [Flavobacteriaceae bacterium]|nr:pyridoxal-phosphate dependent enzyme [Flavobacteriaceae bacterium]
MAFSDYISKNLDISFLYKFSENIEVFIKREDLIHPNISGNKYRKLKYNLLEAQKLQKQTLLTFGGAFSNHIAATAAAGKEFGFKTMGIIRGDELENNFQNNPTLRFAKNCGMELHFVSRDLYRQKNNPGFIEHIGISSQDIYILPEGGTNTLAVKGCEEILNENDLSFDCLCVSVGTGGTLAGIVNSSQEHQNIIGFSALKGDFLSEEIKKYISKTNWKITDAYSFGGYGKINSELVSFINKFKKETGIPLDPVYTGKMMFGISDLIKKGAFPKNSRILALHTGGLQGIPGMNLLLQQKKLPIIE